MALRLEAVTYDARDPSTVALFWATLLGRPVVREPGGACVPGDDIQLGLRFESSTRDRGPRRLHLHLTSESADHEQRTVDDVLHLGGRHLDVGQLPEEDHVVLADPEDNEFCVIGPGNRFLAGCGFLGEVTCEGTREVGLFWSRALDWPLVWDHDGETAVQSPFGGTKVSWGGPPITPKSGPNSQRFDLVADDLDAEVERLSALGAIELARHEANAELADPDGNEFRVRLSPQSGLGRGWRPGT